MSLLKLPPEILVQIFDHVGSSYFRSDLSRLAVCKQWSGKQHCTALGSPFQYQPLITSSRSLGLENSSASLRAYRDRSLKVLGSPFRYEPTRGSLFTPSPLSLYTMQAPSKVFNAGGMAEPLGLMPTTSTPYIQDGAYGNGL
ncbi:hypothetical protein B0T21DRAFT_343089 [Apiosordaria backusii]|uniref:F-box domain-containing protein n=1 Tax=Apiosordaria backusii TaxID=314023 RepID=A0AA40EXP0_9PEZI|nr:hypothetical protein B0T21DRAFT_343089 [Apiosordaria backusii]